ncbi:hypothetical protein [Gordonia iterans]
MIDAPTGRHHWERAVEFGAHGRVAAARTVLDEVAAAAGTSAAVTSLAASTRGSLIRQAGGHRAARAADGRACALASAAATGQGGPWLAAAWVDGLVGLAADGLGVADFAGSRALLDRADRFLGEHFPPGPDEAGEELEWCTVPRVRLRVSWVRTEWGLYSGDLDTARSASAASQILAERLPSPRHRLKTELIAAAVAAAAGDTPGARRAAREVFDRTGELGLAPLRWAAATLLTGVTPGGGEYPAEADRLRAILARRGMPIAPLTLGERHGR